MNKKWNNRFLKLAKHISTWSKDPSTKVGCVVVGPDKEIRSTGFNGFPRGIEDNNRLLDREQKYPIICHAEENAIMHAARIGVPLKDCIMYITHPPCCRCARSIIQAGINKVVYYKDLSTLDNWLKDIHISLNLLKEANVKLEPIDIEEENETST